MDKYDLIEMVKRQIMVDVSFKSEILAAIRNTDFAWEPAAVAAATILAGAHKLEVNEQVIFKDYVLAVALKFSKLIQEKIGACYLKPKEGWNVCIENSLIDLCKRTNREEVAIIDAYIKRVYPNFEESINVFEILENFRRQG